MLSLESLSYKLAQEGSLQDLDYKHKTLHVLGRRGPAFDT